MVEWLVVVKTQIIGAVLALIQQAGNINVFINLFLHKFGNSPILLSFILFIFIASASTFMGMGAEFIPLITIFLLISKRLGYDRLFGLGVLTIAMDVGWSTAITNQHDHTNQWGINGIIVHCRCTVR